RRHPWLDDQSGVRQPLRHGAVDPRTEHDFDDEFCRMEGVGVSRRRNERLCDLRSPCTMYFAAYRLWDRFRNAPWQRIVRLGLVPVIMGLVIASGTVMARAADAGWRAAAVTIAAAAITLATRLNPLWLLV